MHDAPLLKVIASMMFGNEVQTRKQERYPNTEIRNGKGLGSEQNLT
jgi:hypothetical protein